RSTMLEGKGDRLANFAGQLQVLGLVRLKKRSIAVERGPRRIDIAEHLRPGGFLEVLAAPNVELGPRLLALIAIEEPDRNVDAEPDVDRDWRSAAGVHGEGRVGRAIGNREPVIGLRLIHRRHRCQEVRAIRQREIVQLVERAGRLGEVEYSGDIELLY